MTTTSVTVHFVTLTHFRRKRDASGSVSPSSANDNVINPNDIPVPVQEPAPAQPLRGNLTWPTAKNITQEMAQNMCKLPILESPVYHLCVNFTQDSFDSIVSSCVDDLQVFYSFRELMTFRSDNQS
jgi:hypothetical protein